MRSRPPSRFWVGTSVPMPVSPAIDPDHASGYARTLVKAKSARQWTTMLGELEAFYEAYGHFWVEEHKGRYPALAVWWLRIRGRLETLTYDQVLGLDNLGFFGQIDQQWLNRYAQLRRFKKKHGHCKVPSLWPDNPSLGFWVSNQRQKAAELVMPAWRRKLLTDLGFCFRVPRTGPLAQWDEFIKCLKRYKKRFGNCNIPRNWSEDKRLNPWISQLRALRKSLDRDKVKQLDSLGFDWNPFASTWEKRFRELEKFKKQHGHYRVPRTARKLGNWVMSIRHRKKRLSEAQIRRLNEIGFDWSPRDTIWSTRYKDLLAFRRKFGHSNVPKNWPKNPDLATWVIEQRIYKNTLSPKRIALLKKAGFDWNPHETSWMRRYQELKAYHMKNGRSPASAESALGIWVANQRQIYTRMKMPAERKKLLDKIGFVWRILGRLK